MTPEDSKEKLLDMIISTESFPKSHSKWFPKIRTFLVTNWINLPECEARDALYLFEKAYIHEITEASEPEFAYLHLLFHLLNIEDNQPIQPKINRSQALNNIADLLSSHTPNINH